MMDTVSRLLLLLDVAECGSFAKAAEIRNVDRSVVSKQIRKLEDEMGVRVLNRSTRALSPTSVGAELVKQARSVRDLLADTRRLAENYQEEPRGKLRITSTTQFGRTYVNRAVAQYLKRFPDVDIELRSEDRIVDLIGEGFDLAIRMGEPQDSNLIARQLAPNRLILVGSPEFIQKYGEPKTIEELEKLPAVTYARHGFEATTFNYFDEQGELRTARFKSRYKANEVDVIVNGVEAGLGYAVMPTSMICKAFGENKLIQLLPDVKLQDFGTIYMVYPHRDMPVRTRLFIETLQQVVGDPPEWEQCIPNK